MFNPDELRMLGFSAPLLLKLLKTREESVINQMYGDFNAGKLDQVQNLARLSALRELQQQLNAAQAAFEPKEKKP